MTPTTDDRIGINRQNLYKTREMWIPSAVINSSGTLFLEKERLLPRQGGGIVQCASCLLARTNVPTSIRSAKSQEQRKRNAYIHTSKGTQEQKEEDYLYTGTKFIV